MSAGFSEKRARGFGLYTRHVYLQIIRARRLVNRINAIQDARAKPGQLIGNLQKELAERMNRVKTREEMFYESIEQARPFCESLKRGANKDRAKTSVFKQAIKPCQLA